MTEVVAKRAKDRQEILWAVESDENFGIDATQRLIDAARSLTDVSEYFLEREEWSGVVAVTDGDSRPMCGASEKRRVGDKILYRTDGGVSR